MVEERSICRKCPVLSRISDSDIDLLVKTDGVSKEVDVKVIIACGLDMDD
jgi:hypothetical protein